MLMLLGGLPILFLGRPRLRVPSLTVEPCHLLPAEMKITSYNHHLRRLLSSQRLCPLNKRLHRFESGLRSYPISPCVLCKAGTMLESRDFGQSQKPALHAASRPPFAKEREEWGTHFMGRSHEIKGWARFPRIWVADDGGARLATTGVASSEAGVSPAGEFVSA